MLWAAKSGHVKVVELLLKSGASFYSSALDTCLDIGMDITLVVKFGFPSKFRSIQGCVEWLRAFFHVEFADLAFKCDLEDTCCLTLHPV